RSCAQSHRREPAARARCDHSHGAVRGRRRRRRRAAWQAERTPAAPARNRQRPVGVLNAMKPATRRRTRLLLGIAVFYVALWLLWLTPVIFPLKIFVVLLHEISHALAALATGGAVERIVLNMNQGGATYVLGGNAFVILSAGYLGSLLWGLLLIELAGARAKRARWALGVLGAFVLVIAGLYVRNLFGFVFTATFGAALIVAARHLPPR